MAQHWRKRAKRRRIQNSRGPLRERGSLARSRETRTKEEIDPHNTDSTSKKMGPQRPHLAKAEQHTQQRS